MNKYLSNSDIVVKSNANKGYSIGGLILYNSAVATQQYWKEIYPKEAIEAMENGTIYIHNMDMLTSYCAGWSIKDIIINGFRCANDYISAKPAKHFSTLLSQLVNFLGVMQNEHAGAQSLSSFDTFLSPYVKFDKLNYNQVKQELQQFLFSINVPSRWGGECPFTNITLDLNVPEDLKETNVYWGGTILDNKYSEFQEEMNMIDEALFELYYEGDSKNRPFTFPIPTINITKQFNYNTEKVNKLMKLTSRYGTPYFQNFVNSNLDPRSIHAMCCRLRLDKNKLITKTGGLFGYDDKTGSIGVVTINLANIAYKRTKQEFVDELDKVLNVCYETLEKKRKVINKFYKDGLYPNTKLYLGDIGFKHHFSTIGVLGGAEAVMELTGSGLKQNIDFIKNILMFISDKLIEFQHKSGNLYNLEATPAEMASYKLAMIDKENRKDCILNKLNRNYYTNSTMFSAEELSDDLWEDVEMQQEIQNLYTGGTVHHVYLGEEIPDIEITKKIIKSITTNYTLPYFTLTPTFSICSNCGYIRGEVYKCNKCGSETSVYSRIVGYYRPLKYWNEGKVEEYRDRKKVLL